MSLDVSTLFIVAVSTCALAGGLLFLTWLQHRGVSALAMWSLAFVMGAIATALITARGAIPNVWSIVIGNAILAAGYGIMWSGVRSFFGRSTIAAVVVAGALIWLIACQFEWFYGSLRARIILMSLIIATYSLLSAWEFWRVREEGLASRWAVLVLLVIHAGIFLARIPGAGALPIPTGPAHTEFNWLTLIVFEAILFAFGVTYFIASMVRERETHAYRTASLTDPLTGVANRRAFFERGARVLRRAARGGHTPAVLLFDLDDFKQLNDRFGHQAGDETLKLFSRVATSVLRPDDLFGRIGGEEFACVMAHVSLADARQAAERVRVEFAGSPIATDGQRVYATVSVGVGVAGPEADMEALFAAADRALYRAKRRGRNCVEVDTSGQASVAHLPAAAG